MLKSKSQPLSLEEVKKMQNVGRLAGQTLLFIAPYVQAGISTNELDRLVYQYTIDNGAQAAPLGYHGYPKSVCTSINDIVCHGLPDETILKDGDIINVDVTCVKDGFFGDTSKTFMVGNVSENAKKLVEAAEAAMFKGIEQVAPFNTTGDIGFAIDRLVTRSGYSTVKEIGGHGIGRKFHDDPFVPSFGKKGKGDVLKPWHCITVEPMVNEGVEEVDEFPISGSTIRYYRTKDRKLSAQFEHTILVTDKGFEILTRV